MSPLARGNLFHDKIRLAVTLAGKPGITQVGEVFELNSRIALLSI